MLYLVTLQKATNVLSCLLRNKMKVIVAGMPKTGTKSMSAALEKLGYQVYDFLENLYYLENEWEKIFKDKCDVDIFRRMYQNVDAVSDLPACHYWQEIHEAFPDAKIILTVRDSEDVWLNSLLHHIEKMDKHVLARVVQIVEILIGRMGGLMLTLSWKVILGIDRAVLRRRTEMNKLQLKIRYRSHNAHVMRNAPRDKLLVYNCKEGWKPLCEFLEVPVPNEPFPHNNIKASLVDTTAHHPIAKKYQLEVFNSVVRAMFKYGIVVILIVSLARFLFQS